MTVICVRCSGSDSRVMQWRTALTAKFCLTSDCQDGLSAVDSLEINPLLQRSQLIIAAALPRIRDRQPDESREIPTRRYHSVTSSIASSSAATRRSSLTTIGEGSQQKKTRPAQSCPESRFLLSPTSENISSTHCASHEIKCKRQGCRHQFRMSCRTAGANSPSELWELLANSRDVQREITRFNSLGYYHTEGAPREGLPREGLTNVKHAYMLDDDVVDKVDNAFFFTTPHEAVAMDPQQRMLLEVAYEAVENAGIPLDDFVGTDTAVFAGLSSRMRGFSSHYG